MGQIGEDGDEKVIKAPQGEKIPLVIKIAWGLLILWGIYYLAVYMWPDLLEWMKK